MGDDQGGAPLARRVPGATRAAPGEVERPVLPEALLQRMQAVVSAAHAQAAEEQRLAREEQARRERAARQDQAVPKSSPSLPLRTRAAGHGRKLLPGAARPASSAPAWTNADDDTSPLPRLTASGAVAAADADTVPAQPDWYARLDHGAPAPAERAAMPDHAPGRDRVARRDRHAAKRERAARREQERAAQQRRPAAAVQGPVDRLGHSRPGVRNAPGRRWQRPAALVASALVLVTGGSVAVALAATGSTPPASSPGRSAPAPALAVAWVADQVSRTATVACDPGMCHALRASGVDRLLVLGPTTTDPRRSQLIIATAAVRQEFGASLGLSYAPSVIASFGSGDARIDIRVVAPNGPVAYQAALQTDLQNRKQAGTELLGSPRVVASASARRQMLAGQVSSQLLIVMTSLATLHPVDILAFGDSAPGASAGMPLRSVQLSEGPGAAVARQWLDFLRVQRNPFLPAVIRTIRRDGKPVLLLEFAAPSPLGLFAS